MSPVGDFARDNFFEEIVLSGFLLGKLFEEEKGSLFVEEMFHVGADPIEASFIVLLLCLDDFSDVERGGHKLGQEEPFDEEVNVLEEVLLSEGIQSVSAFLSFSAPQLSLLELLKPQLFLPLLRSCSPILVGQPLVSLLVRSHL